jgi:plastocyanin
MTRLLVSAARRVRALAPAIFLAIAVLAAAAFAACGDDDDNTNTAPTARPTTNSGAPAKLTAITVSDNKFSPSDLQVPVGATVTWNWTGSNFHSVVGKFEGEDVNSPRLMGTGQYLFAFQKAGTFEYQCGVHGASMTGKITIVP